MPRKDGTGPMGIGGCADLNGGRRLYANCTCGRKMYHGAEIQQRGKMGFCRMPVNFSNKKDILTAQKEALESRLGEINRQINAV